MSENQVSPGADAGVVTPVRDAVAAGQRLRQAREAAGLHVVALAAALKVPVKKLEALEAGRSDELLDATFARALAASVCRQLKIDPTEVLALLPLAGGSRLGEDQALNTPFRPTREPAAASRAPQGVPKAAWIAMGILLAAAVVWWAVPPVNDTTPQAAMPAEPLQPAAPSEGATSMGSVANVSEETTAPPSDTSAVANTTAPAVPVAVPEAVKTTSPATPAPVAASAAATPEILAIRARGDTWVEVSGGGKLLLQRVVKAGESVALTDAPPLAVVIGRVDATEILVRGQAFDLGAVARNNVARFEVK